MPRKGSRYANLTVLKEVREELDRLREELRLTSLNDVLAVLVKTYREHTSIASKLEKLHTSITSKLDELHTSIASIHTSIASTVSSERTSVTSTHTSSASIARRKKSIREVIGDLKVQLLSEVKPRNPSAFLRKAREEGVVIVEGAKGDVALVDPEFWAEFKTLLKHLPYRLEEAEIELGGEEEKLFKFLRENALIYFDSKENRWKSTVNNLR